MRNFSKWPGKLSIFFLLCVFLLKDCVLCAVDEKEAKRARIEPVVSASAAVDPTITDTEWSLTQDSSLWKSTLNFFYTPFSPPINVDGWHHMNGSVIPILQREAAKTSSTPSPNVALAGLQCIYREVGGDRFGVTKIINLPKIFVSGCKPTSPQNFIDKACVSLPQGSAESVQKMKTTHDGLYGVGSGYTYPGFDKDYYHLRAYMEQNFNLWLGESSHLSGSYVQSKLQVIKKDGYYNSQFASHYFHSEQAVLAYLESEIGIDFLFTHLFHKLPEAGGKRQIVQLVLHISSYYDVCGSCADTLFRECEVGRMFLGKLEGRLKSQHYLYPNHQLSLMVESSGILEYKRDGVGTRPRGFEDGLLFRSPIVSVQTPLHIVRMKIGERR